MGREHELGALVRSYRRSAGLTQHGLAANSGLSIAAVRDIEQGRRPSPRKESLAALAKALGLDSRQAHLLQHAARREIDTKVAGSVGPGPGHHENGLWIAVLGPLAVWRNGQPVVLGSQARQVILGLLVIDPNISLRRETLVDLLWGGHPPRTAADLVQAHVSRLRPLLWPGNSDGSGMPKITSIRGEYRLLVSDKELDLLAFRTFVRRAAQSSERGDVATACMLYGQAFELVRGDPYTNVSVLMNHPAVTKLRSELASALLSYAEACAALDRHDLVLHRLETLAAAEPLNERIHARLMIALASCGQQAAALRVYEELRLRLDRELGIYPGEELAEAHLRLLRQDLRTAGVPDVRMASHPCGTPIVVPRQLPAAPPYLAGRGSELTTLTGLIPEPSDVPTAIRVVALTGMAGVGKSALAVYWAHRVAARFPDGQLFTDLRGFSPRGVPAAPTEAICGFLQALGVHGWRIPADIDGQRTLYRTLLARRRLLIVLDNAQDAEQVRPLLPGEPGCFVLITSRNRLTGLAASHSAYRLSMDCLTEASALRLLIHALGAARVRAEVRAASELISLCAGLPLALCNVLARASSHPCLSLAELATTMRDEQGRLDTLDTGEKATSARTVFSWSRARLSDRADRVFRLMALQPIQDITVPAVASLTGLTRRDARLALAELADGHLISERVPGCYSCHDLLRAYAEEIARARETDAERRDAAHRVPDH